MVLRQFIAHVEIINELPIIFNPKGKETINEEVKQRHRKPYSDLLIYRKIVF